MLIFALNIVIYIDKNLIMSKDAAIEKGGKLTQEVILEALKEVSDPEIPVLSVVDLGIISDIKVSKDNKLTIKMTPTFSACPALMFMQVQIQKRAEKIPGVKEAEVIIDRENQWSSNSITEEGLKALKKFGLAPPPKYKDDLDVKSISKIQCPFCDSEDTKMNSAFGPTLCRSVHYCNNCLQSFEQFKPL